jgi:hypothetical protein
MDLDFPDVSGRRSDKIESFCLFVEQLEEAVQSLRSGRLARQRMALVALDNLAEVLLHEFAQQIFLTSDQAAWLPGPRFTQRKRRRMGADFRRRVSLASQSPAPSGFYPQPLLDDLDASIFRVAHRYRNDVYHAGRHNRALIEPLSQMYAQAVSRAFVRSQPEVTMGGGSIVERVQELDRFDWREGMTGEVFIPRVAAARIVSQICSFPDLVPSDLASKLSRDLDGRCFALADDLDELKRARLDDGAIASMLESAQLWAAHRGDEEILRLQEERQDLIFGLEPAKTDDARREALETLERAELERVATLVRGFVFRLTLQDVEAIRSRATTLLQLDSVPRIVQRYHQLDEHLDQLELAIDWMLLEWDRLVQFEVDLLRGK